MFQEKKALEINALIVSFQCVCEREGGGEKHHHVFQERKLYGERET